jgi:hypothetical protein
MTAKQQNSFPLRMPEDLRARIEARAKTTERSANSEIVWMLTAMLDRDSDLAAVPADILLKEAAARLGAKVQIVVSPEAAATAGIGGLSKPKAKRRV